MNVIIIAGPTASGKTALGVSLAKKLNGEIVSCDSMQIYRDLPICSAQPDEDEKEGIPHHLMGFADAFDGFSVEEYREKALCVIRDIISRGKQPIVVGGTGMYFHYLIYTPEFAPKSDGEVRKEFDGMTTEELYRQYVALGGETIEKNDRKRLIRALETHILTGSLPQKSEKKRNGEFDFKMFCISPKREVLYGRINLRVDRMFSAGLEEEVKALFLRRVTEENQCAKAIGCRQLFEYFRGECTFEEAKEKIKQESRRYAKRQLTWMRKEDAFWIDPDVAPAEEQVLAELERVDG